MVSYMNQQGLMRELYVIVHENKVYEVAEGTNPVKKEEARRVLGEIQEIKQTKNHLNYDGDILFLSRPLPGMPKPSSDLMVYIAGGVKWVCCSIHLAALRAHGYNAKFYDPACFDDGLGRDTFIAKIPNAEKFIPEYFE